MRKVLVELEIDDRPLSERRSLWLREDMGRGTLEDGGGEFSVASCGTHFEVNYPGGRMATVDIGPVILELARAARGTEY